MSHRILIILVALIYATVLCTEDNIKKLHRAASYGDEGKVRELLNAGTDPDAVGNNGWTALHYLVWFRHREQANVAVDSGWPALHYLTPCEHEVVAGVLFEYGADFNAVNNDGSTPLLRAVLFEHEKLVEKFLKYGADPNIKIRCAKTGKFVESPLRLAIISRCKGIAKILLKGGADANPEIEYFIKDRCLREIRLIANALREARIQDDRPLAEMPGIPGPSKRLIGEIYLEDETVVKLSEFLLEFKPSEKKPQEEKDLPGAIKAWRYCAGVLYELPELNSDEDALQKLKKKIF